MTKKRNYKPDKKNTILTLISPFIASFHSILPYISPSLTIFLHTSSTITPTLLQISGQLKAKSPGVLFIPLKKRGLSHVVQLSAELTHVKHDAIQTPHLFSPLTSKYPSPHLSTHSLVVSGPVHRTPASSK